MSADEVASPRSVERGRRRASIPPCTSGGGARLRRPDVAGLAATWGFRVLATEADEAARAQVGDSRAPRAARSRAQGLTGLAGPRFRDMQERAGWKAERYGSRDRSGLTIQPNSRHCDSNDRSKDLGRRLQASSPRLIVRPRQRRLAAKAARISTPMGRARVATTGGSSPTSSRRRRAAMASQFPATGGGRGRSATSTISSRR